VTISVVQSTDATNAFTASFASNVTAGNTVFVVVTALNDTSGVTISSTTAPTLGGSSVTGAVQLWAIQSGYNSSAGFSVFTTAWMLPNCPSGQKAVAITLTNGSTNTYCGTFIYEVSGLGAGPVADRTSTGQNSNNSAVTSGTTAAIQYAPEIILGGFCAGGGPVTPSGYTNQFATGNISGAGYQIAASSGGTYSYGGTASASNAWAAGIATIAAGAPAAAAPDVPQVQPGPVWLRLFKPWTPKPAPVPPVVQAVNATGSLSLAPLSLSGQGGPLSAAADVPQVQPGPTWLGLFKSYWPKPRQPAPPAGPPAVNATGSLTLAPLALSGQGGESSPDQPQTAPGPVWLRLFRPWLARPVPPVPSIPAVNASGGITLAPLTLSGTAGQTSPDQPQADPGPLWSRLFRPWAPKPLPPPPATPAVNATGSLSLAPLTLSGSGGQSSPDVPQAQPGPFWLRLFKPGLTRPVPPPPAVQGINATGNLALAPLALSGTAAQTSPDVPQIDPGPSWLRFFKPGLQRPAPQVPSSSGVQTHGGITLAPLSLSGTAAQTSPDQPSITPGPSWLRLFRPWAQRPVPPLPGPNPPGAATCTGSLALAPLSLSGAAGQTSPDIPSVQPGPVWSRLFRPWAARPVPPLPAQQAVTSTGSLSLAPLALSGTGGQSSPDVPTVQPGPFWQRLFRPWLARPVPPPPATPAVSASGGITLAPLSLSGAGAVKGGSPDAPQVQPGPSWLRFFKPWVQRPVPVNAGQGAVTITSSGGITLAPIALSGNAEGQTPVFSAGPARWAWDAGPARWTWSAGSARNQ